MTDEDRLPPPSNFSAMLGIETVAVHSDADAGLPFVREADAAVRLPGDAPLRRR